MKHDGIIILATGLSAKTRVWENKKWRWSAFVQKIREGHRTTETYKRYMAATKEEQLKIKDVGGFVGGRLVGGKRSPQNVASRQLVTLDIDFADVGMWSDVTILFDCAAVLHTTHKHSPESPRYRLLIPLDREVSAEEYTAISRSIAGSIGIEKFDNTTFETNRLMFWPSTASDGEYICEIQDGPWLNADSILSAYIDWRDSSLWPMADRRDAQVRSEASKQQDPEQKQGIVGAFCRTYSIGEAIEKFLPEIYTETVHKDRYTFTGGTSAAGLIVYDDLFAFSHHGTDPIGGKLCNAFDLVRLHLFGHLDTTDVVGVKTKSYAAMESMALADEAVKKTVSHELLASAQEAFADGLPIEVDNDPEAEDWLAKMEIDGKGKFISSAANISNILANDPNLKDAFKENIFDYKKYICKNTPWRKVFKPEPIKNVDLSGIRNYIERLYGIAATSKIDDALALEFEKKAFHPVRDYLNGLEWDGVNRIWNLLPDYFGADDNIYTFEAMQTTMVGAVARVFRPGCKFDTMLVLVGAEGLFKSTFIRVLAKHWHSDSFTTVQGKEAAEQLHGAWLIEVAELAGLRKSDVESQKHFITKQEDTYRPAYGRVIETYPRQCVFIGTTNEVGFLKGSTGNRRFLPIATDAAKVKKSVIDDLPDEVDQLWAEAVALFKENTPMYLSSAANEIAVASQRQHTEADERTGLIQAYLDTPLSEKWSEMDLFARRLYLEDAGATEGKQREAVCAAEVWCECLGKNKEELNRYNSREINDILRSLEGWEAGKSTKDFAIYGVQRFYKRLKIK